MTRASAPDDRPPGLPLRLVLHRRLRQAVLVLLVVTLTTLGVAGIVLGALMPQVTRADNMLAALQDGHVAMVNQETGVRGFLVTRDEQFLQPSEEGAADLRTANATLSAWAAGDPALRDRLSWLRQAEQQWITGWARPLLTSRPELTDTQALSASLLRGKALFDEYRSVEATVRAAVQADRDAAVERERVALSAGAAVDVAILLGALLVVRRSNRRITAELVPPVQELRETLAALTAGDLDRTALGSGPAEFRDIAADVNELSGALREEKRAVAVREEQLVTARDEAEKAGHAKTAFLATMSHEIRTPLNAVLGLTDILLTTDLTEEQRNHLDTISGSGDSLLTLINDILDFSKIEAGELDLEDAQFDLHDLVYDVAQLLSQQASGKGLDLLVDIPSDCPWQVIGDGPRLRQVLINLVGNALKFTARGHVLVRVGTEVLDGRLHGRIAVSDTGIGIPAVQRHRLFRSFSQVDASTTRSYGGTGLGLAISQRIANAMGGDITVESTEGAGSTFTVDVVLGVPSVVPVRAATDTLAGRRLLVVDDNPTNLEILDHQLTRLGASCVLARSGEEALAAVSAPGASFDAGLLDLHMPVMAGDELAVQLRRHEVAARLPLILLSSATAVPSARMSAFSARLHKPVRPERLLQTLQAAFREGADRAPAGTRTGVRPVERAAGAPTLRVLVAEDHEVNAHLVRLYLRQLGHDSHVVVDGRAAVEAVREGRFDLVLMDAQMPVMGGVEATRAIRLLPGAQPRIIALTASVLAADRQAFETAGADGFLTKPVRLAVLQQALDGLVAQLPAGSIPAPRGEADGALDAEGPLDAEVVADLRDLDDEEFAHLYRRYLDTLDETVAAIASAAGRPAVADDDASVHRLAHRLKGSSAAMGATGLAEICRRIEAAEHLAAERPTADAPTSDADLDAALTALDREHRRVRTAVTELLAGTAG